MKQKKATKQKYYYDKHAKWLRQMVVGDVVMITGGSKQKW